MDLTKALIIGFDSRTSKRLNNAQISITTVNRCKIILRLNVQV
jgi:hypothetical protein